MTDRRPEPAHPRFAAPSTARVGARVRARQLRDLRGRIGRQITEFRTDAGATIADLARCADIDPAHLWRIEAGTANASLETLVAIADCLGSDLGVRMFPAAGPRIHDRFQAPMLEALVRRLGTEWHGQPELPVPSVRGVIDLVLRRARDHLTIVCECHSELRRLELVLRRAAEKTDAVRAQADVASSVSTLLLIRSTTATRAIVNAYASTIAAPFPARSRDAIEALTGAAGWPGAAIVWARFERGRAVILDQPPRPVRVGR
jgi:transcriptional regulator with XRE-family HTH domain